MNIPGNRMVALMCISSGPNCRNWSQEELRFKHYNKSSLRPGTLEGFENDTETEVIQQKTSPLPTQQPVQSTQSAQTEALVPFVKSPKVEMSETKFALSSDSTAPVNVETSTVSSTQVFQANQGVGPAQNQQVIGTTPLYQPPAPSGTTTYFQSPCSFGTTNQFQPSFPCGAPNSFQPAPYFCNTNFFPPQAPFYDTNTFQPQAPFYNTNMFQPLALFCDTSLSRPLGSSGTAPQVQSTPPARTPLPQPAQPDVSPAHNDQPARRRRRRRRKRRGCD